jgi:hypothetical protein
MARYTIRVELHEGTWQDYVELGKCMAAQDMVDVITDGNGKRYKMPPAEYNYDGPAPREQVLAMAESCATRVVKSFGVLVTESNGRTWYGLREL